MAVSDGKNSRQSAEIGGTKRGEESSIQQRENVDDQVDLDKTDEKLCELN